MMGILSFKAVRLPGVAKPSIEGPFDIVLSPGEPRIARASFEARLPIGPSSHLAFTISCPGPVAMRADIIGGDVGFPSIHLQNANGTILRFARGNLKDFFDISRPDVAQKIVLPIASFVYDRDNSQNVPPEGAFFDHPVVKLYFDFLRDPEESIDIRLDEIATEEGAAGSDFPDIRDLVIFERVGQARQLPRFSSETESLSFGISLNANGLRSGVRGAQLLLSVMKVDGTEADRTEILLSEENAYLALNMPHIGGYRLHGKIVRDGKTLAQSDWPICRVPPDRSNGRISGLAAKLGISDEFNYDRIAVGGGAWDRIVIKLSTLARDAKEGLRFGYGQDPFPRLPPGPGRFRVMAPFAMPKHLSRLPDRPDYYRYGTEDWDGFGEVVAWLAWRAADAGVTHYEVWNEFTALGHWNDSIDVVLKLHKITYAAVKRVAPEMIVLGGCTHSWTETYLRDFLASGGAEHCDGLAIHGYTYQPWEGVDLFAMIENLIETYCPNRPEFGVFITEMGFRSPAFSEEDQAYWFAFYTLEIATRDLFRAILWFRFTNPREELLSGYRQASSTGYALIGHNDSYCRPAYVAYRMMANALARCEKVRAANAQEGDGSSGGKRFYTGWRDGMEIMRAGTGTPEPLPSGWSRLEIPGKDGRCIFIDTISPL